MIRGLAQLMDLVPVRMAGLLVHFQWQIIFLPWNFFLFSLSTLTGIFLRFLVFTGASLPSGYADKDTLEKMQSVIEHMHSREDQYRRKIKEQQEQHEALRCSNKKYSARVKKLTSDMAMYQQEHTSREPTRSQSVDTSKSWHVHVAFTLAVFLTIWLLNAPWVPPISKKVVKCLVWPLVLLWVCRFFLPRKPGLWRDASHSLAFFLIGYISCHWINAVV
eukprot:jgi/Botrbrau1/16183/Bobra.0342s0001.1